MRFVTSISLIKGKTTPTELRMLPSSKNVPYRISVKCMSGQQTVMGIQHALYLKLAYHTTGVYQYMVVQVVHTYVHFVHIQL